jgi:nucleoside-diphosphate kinase
VPGHWLDSGAMAAERTLVLVKPDGVQRGLIGDIIARLEHRGLHLVGMKLIRIDRELAQRHYAEHRDKAFFSGLVDFITSAPVVAMVWEGRGAVALVRTMMGTTDPAAASPGTIRGDYAVSIGANVVHGSDSVHRAQEEIALYFSAGDLLEWESSLDAWVND